MKRHHLNDMVKGWFVGDFTPAALHSNGFEVGVKTYKAGEEDLAHYHKVATEITCIIQGRVEMAGEILSAGDIITLEPHEANTFKALEDTTLVVVKTPSAKDDKYLIDPEET